MPSIARLEARARRARIAAAVCAACTLFLGALVARSAMSVGQASATPRPLPTQHVAAAHIAAPPLPVAPPPQETPAVAAAPAVPAPAAPAEEELPAVSTGDVIAPPSKTSHRIFIDGHFVGESG